MTDYQKHDAYLEQNLDASIQELSRLVAQPSVGAQDLGAWKSARHWSARCWKNAASPSKSSATEGAPVVFAERKGQKR
jgi:hypothetical protein